MAIKNTHKVSKSQWKKWSHTARFVFNSTYELMLDQSLFVHPKAVEVKAEHWKTTAWNAAWMAACHVDEYEDN